MKNKEIKNKSIKEIYKECFDFIRESKNQIYFAIGVFIFFILIGYFIPLPEELELQLIKRIREIVIAFEGLTLWQTIWMIFSNNLLVCFISIILGIFLGVFPFLILMSNGYLIGYVAQKAVFQEGILILWKLIPHGIFEIPAILLSVGLGFKMGSSLFRKNDFRQNFKNAMMVFLFVIVGLLIIAALIEGMLIFLAK